MLGALFCLLHALLVTSCLVVPELPPDQQKDVSPPSPTPSALSPSHLPGFLGDNLHLGQSQPETPVPVQLQLIVKAKDVGTVQREDEGE